jgi:hypothetical protein
MGTLLSGLDVLGGDSSFRGMVSDTQTVLGFLGIIDEFSSLSDSLTDGNPSDFSGGLGRQLAALQTAAARAQAEMTEAASAAQSRPPKKKAPAKRARKR